MRSEGIFTPPSFEGTVIFPGTAGGSNWGSVAVDPERKLLFANTSRVANWVQIVRREEVDLAAEEARWGGNDYLALSPMEGTPYVARFGVLVSPFGTPCNPPPWGTLAALDLSARELRWETPLGTTRDLAPLGIALPWGTPSMGGPLSTAGGLVFIAAALDDYLRAFDSETGKELWRGRLPAGGQATPMTYRVRDGGRQVVVIAAGGHAHMRTRRGDHLVAFALPEGAP
jgi:quinoprotein glucose dehydrogenase